MIALVGVTHRERYQNQNGVVVLLGQADPGRGALHELIAGAVEGVDGDFSLSPIASSLEEGDLWGGMVREGACEAGVPMDFLFLVVAIQDTEARMFRPGWEV